MAEEINLRIKNWERFNPRNDIKKPSWFRFEHDFFSHPAFYDFSFEERSFWVYLLCERSKLGGDRKHAPIITVKLDFLHRVHGFDKKCIHRAIEKLIKERIVEMVTVRGRYADVGDLYATNERTRRTERDERDETLRTNETNLPRLPSQSRPKEKSLGAKIFESYSEAFRNRYGVDPVRNQKVNKNCSDIGSRLGEDGIAVAKFFISHNDSFYLRTQHPIGIFLRDAESLHTQWQRGRAVTGADVRNFEKHQSIISAGEEAAKLFQEHDDEQFR